uniref:ESAT-6-like protein n=1 Tax=Eubacterium cellulosolvens (strain ATCC 43171 / JCM 9499 / 6) TaxID=633697 RepID=I5AXP8_EUBC6
MSDVLNMNFEKLLTMAAKFECEAEAVNERINNITANVEEMKCEWQGASSEAFDERWKRIAPIYREGVELLKEMGEALRRTARLTEAHDNRIAAQMMLE